MKGIEHFSFRKGWWLAVAWCFALGVASCATEPVGPEGGDGVDGVQQHNRFEPPYDTICGDGVCSGSETLANCPEDCTPTPFCGDGACNGGETPATCPADCSSSPVCGDGVCSGPSETAATCPVDCVPATCGDCICSFGEAQSCPWDCNVPGYPSWCLDP